MNAILTHFTHRFSIWKAENVHRSTFPLFTADNDVNYANYVDLNVDDTFSFTRFCGLSAGEVEKVTLGGLIYL